jgi:hypothetical protein
MMLLASSWSLSCSPVKSHRRAHGRNASNEVVQTVDYIELTEIDGGS